MTQEAVIFDDLNPPEAYITSGRAYNVRYRLSGNHVATPGDWVGLFRCTDDICELVGFEWAATDDPPKDPGHRRRTLYFHADQIKRPLRATDDDFYHFAYVTRIGRIAGQSGHFRLRQGQDTTRRPSAPPPPPTPTPPTSLGPADVCYAAGQCLANCRMLPANNGRNTQALEKFLGVIEQQETRIFNEDCQFRRQNGCYDQTPGMVIDSPNRQLTSLRPDLNPSLRLETSHNPSCPGCQMALRELRSLKYRLEMEVNTGRTTIEETEEDMNAKRQDRTGLCRHPLGNTSKGTGPAREDELMDVIEDLKSALEWSKDRERCLQHQLNLERTLRMELIRSREDLENSRTVNGMPGLNSQQESQRYQVEATDTPSNHTVTKDTKAESSDSLESQPTRYVTEKDVRGRRVLVYTDCLQCKEHQKHQRPPPQQQQQQLSSISIDRPRRPKKPDEADTESGKGGTAKRPGAVTDRYTDSKESQLTPETLSRQAARVLEQVVPIASQEMEMMPGVQVCDAGRVQRLSEVLGEELSLKVPELQPIRECLGEILALQAAVETSLSEINNRERVVPDVSKRPEASGSENAVGVVEATISPAVIVRVDAEKKLIYPEVVASTKEVKPISVNTERKLGAQKSVKPHGAAGKPVHQNIAEDQVARTANISRKIDRRQSPGNTTVIVKSRDSLTTYSGSNLSLWLMLGNNSEPDRIIAKQTKKGSHKSQRPPRGYELITETKYRGGPSSSAAAPTDAERTASGTNEEPKKRDEEEEEETCLAVLSAGCDRMPSSRTSNDTQKELSVETPPAVKDPFPVTTTPNNLPYHQSPPVAQRSTHRDASWSSGSRQLVLDGAALLSSNETSADFSSSPNQFEAYKAPTNADITCYHVLTSSPSLNLVCDGGSDDDSLPVILAVPPATVETICPRLSEASKEHSAPDIKRSRCEVAVVSSATCDAQRSLNGLDAASVATRARVDHSTDATGSSSADGANGGCTESAGEVVSPDGLIRLQLYSGTLRSSPSSGAATDDVELIRRLSEVGTRNAVLLDPEERKECLPPPPPSPISPDPLFTSSSRFCFISDETIRCLSGILENALHLTGALQLLDASSRAQTAQPSEVTVTDTVKSEVYSEESPPSSSPAAVDRNLKQVKIIKPMTYGKTTGGVRPHDAVASEAAKTCKGVHSRQPGAAVQNARIISDSIREYHRRMKTRMEIPEEMPRTRKVMERYCFPDPPKGNVKPDAATESDTSTSLGEQSPAIKPLTEETALQAAATGVTAGSYPSSASLPMIAPSVKASTTMTTESAAATCCQMTCMIRQQDSLDLRRCECQAHRGPHPDEKKEYGSSTMDEGSQETTVTEGLEQPPNSIGDKCISTTIPGDLLNNLRPPETDKAVETDGISPAVDGISVKSTGNDLELLTDLSMAAATELE